MSPEWTYQYLKKIKFGNPLTKSGVITECDVPAKTQKKMIS